MIVKEDITSLSTCKRVEPTSTNFNQLEPPCCLSTLHHLYTQAQILAGVDAAGAAPPGGDFPPGAGASAAGSAAITAAFTETDVGAGGVTGLERGTEYELW